MTKATEVPHQRELVVFDAGPVVGFAAASRLPLLVEVFDRIQMRRIVPFAVNREVRRQSSKYPAVARRWAAVVTSGRIEVLSEVAVGLGDQRVVAETARLRDTDPDSAMRTQRDLGEVLAVAHAVVARRDGLNVMVSIDDSYGAQLAATEGLQNLDTVAIMRLAIRLGIIAVKPDLHELYRALCLYSTLPTLTTTGLLDEKFIR